MKSERKSKVKNFTVEVLDFFLGIPEAYFKAFDRKAFYRLMHDFPVEQKLTVSNISQIFSNLKNRGYIEIKKFGNQESVVFTEKAKLATVDKIAARSAVDNNFRFVSFDIPEQLRTSRNKFRRVLKRLGFKQIQKSLWVCNKNIGNLVELAAQEYKVEKYVVYIVSNNTNIDKIINKILIPETSHWSI